MSSESKSAESVKVVVRCRPLKQQEKDLGHARIVEMNTKQGTIEITNPKALKGDAPKQFTFDSVYDWDSKQTDLYEETFRALVDSVLNGFNGTIFAYGQTGTGKTFTMQGVKNDPDLKGVIPHSFDHIFNHIARTTNQQYLVRASYLEICNEGIKDLLSVNQLQRLELRERPDTGVYVKDMSSFVTNSIKEIDHVMNVGNQNRSVGATNMNEHSSQSHAIFTITIECRSDDESGNSCIRVGRLNLVDLAGSERQGKTGAQGEPLKEATKIGMSASGLGNVISALVDGKSSYIPYRASKLTRLLQDSLGGNAKTVMVANIGPADWNFDDTVTTLRFANRAKNIKNYPKINEDPKDALLQEYQQEITRLKEALTSAIILGSETGDESQAEYPNEEGIAKFMEEQKQKLEAEKSAIMNDNSLITEKKQKLLEAMSEKEKKLEQEKQAKEALGKKIHSMESKLLCGGKNIVDHTNEQQ